MYDSLSRRRVGAVAFAAVTATVTATAQVSWRKLTTTEHRHGARAVYDAARQKVVLFGGVIAGGLYSDETQEWDGKRWTLRRPLQRPPGRAYHTMAYDAARQRVVVFGGQGPFPLGDTWEWDGNTWSKRAASGPSARSWSAMCFDPTTRRTILIGGWGNGVAQADHWEWDGRTWRRAWPVMQPPPRAYHAMALDAGRGRIVLFGGWTGRPDIYLGDTWEWTGKTWLPGGATNSPGPRGSHAMAYDPVRSRILLTGGGTTYPRGFGDSWEWDGTRWARLGAAPSPPPRMEHAMAGDAVRRRVVVFGGIHRPGSSRNDTWEWDGSRWTSAGEPSWPSPRSQPAMAFDAARRRVVLFGGYSGDRVSDTWEWDGVRWTRFAVAPSPSVTLSACLAYDPARKRSLLVSTSPDNELWEWNGRRWARLATQVVPTDRYSTAVAFDERRDRLVLFGGAARDWPSRVLGDTWEYDGSDWRLRRPRTSPPARQWHAMAWDDERQRVVLFGGAPVSYPNPGMADLWEWDGVDWVERKARASPPGRHGHALVFDRQRRRLVIHGGWERFGRLPLNDTWEWDAPNWVLRNAVARSRGRFGSVYDAARQRTVVFGGSLQDEMGDMWDYGAERPATFAPFGAGCRGTGGVPSLALVPHRLPWIGESLELAAGSLPPARLAVGLLGQSNTRYHGDVPLPLDLGSPGLPACRLLVRDDVQVPVLVAGGRAVWRVPIPRVSSLVATDIYAQVVAVDPPANAFGLTLSNGGAGVVGAK